MIKSYLRRVIVAPLRPERAQKGQSIIIITFAFLGLLAMLGLALDLGLVYIERVRISRTTDAASLAAVVELPFEEEAFRRASEYIALNGYSPRDTEILVRGCIDTEPYGVDDWRNVAEIAADAPQGIYDPDDPVPTTPTGSITGFVYQPAQVNPPRNRFVIDALAYQAVDENTINRDNCEKDMISGTAGKLRVTGQVVVDMNFMQFFGFGQVPVEDQAVGENVTNLDVVVVFDVSGSMDFETTCFDCWEPTGEDVIPKPWPTNGVFNPVPVVSTSAITPNAGVALCSRPITPLENGGFKYLVHEAELYSQNSPPQSWHFNRRQVGQGFWVLQRASRGASGTDARGAYMRPHPLTVYSQDNVNNNPQLQGAAYNDECFSGPNLSGECWKTRAGQLGVSPPSHTPPRLDYDFTPQWTGATYVWIRAQGGGGYADAWEGPAPAENTPKVQMPDYRRAIFWQVARADGTFPSDIDGGDYTNLDVTTSERRPESGRWRWLRLGSVNTTQGVQYTLRLYQGSAAFNLDKIIFTNYSGGGNGVTIDNGGTVRGGSVDSHFVNLVRQNGGKGPNATDGSATREACNVCNPIFGQTAVNSSQCSCKKSSTDTAVVGPYEAGGSGAFCTRVLTTTNQLTNDLFHDIDPLRSAKEAVKNFAVRLDPKFDQIGFVAFTTNVLNAADGRSKMQCKQYYTKNDPINGVRKCYDPTTSPISYTNVIKAIETHTNLAGTNIGQGMLEGLEELGIQTPGSGYDNSECSNTPNDGQVCDRRGAARRILVLMTDGSPNASGGCHADAKVNLWQGKTGAGADPYDCAIFYAREAYKNNVTVYTIGIGSGANPDLLTAMATGTDPGTGHVYFGSEGRARGGKYYNAAKPSDLDAIFTDILSNIFVRIVG